MTGRAFLLFILCTIAGAAYALPPCEQVGYSLSNPPAWPNYRVGWHSVTAYDPSFGPVCVYPRGAGISINGNSEGFCDGAVCRIFVWDYDWNFSGQRTPHRVVIPVSSLWFIGPFMGPAPYIPPVW
jgi:hypothetical protein